MGEQLSGYEQVGKRVTDGVSSNIQEDWWLAAVWMVVDGRERLWYVIKTMLGLLSP